MLLSQTEYIEANNNNKIKMQLPVGLLVYWVGKSEDNYAIISGMWYYKEMYVPSTIEEKVKSKLDYCKTNFALGALVWYSVQKLFWYY